MTVSELILKLQAFNPDMKVVIEAAEYCDDITRVISGRTYETLGEWTDYVGVIPETSEKRGFMIDAVFITSW